ncbi:hypothetical protein M0811_03519 [Anaeramoeba ignava]|uniref:Uncharacterized protein n=1 Tax=Anaeramoeba ignava TaxID=1746090 RepID=A0A9Q0L522_ANAIG|nr:hypothetical protein M0811_03519 [Anaeramoeba ignava]|eukprot:Anaeramoba_ignava/a220361_12.p2 GENE.a220361_12~~a220361_12.p2  ORF type:complete len:127 (+),score=43.07 a220361_12:780-1160(+)
MYINQTTETIQPPNSFLFFHQSSLSDQSQPNFMNHPSENFTHSQNSNYHPNQQSFRKTQIHPDNGEFLNENQEHFYAKTHSDPNQFNQFLQTSENSKLINNPTNDRNNIFYNNNNTHHNNNSNDFV